MLSDSVIPDLNSFQWIIISSSAGKDSQAMLDFVVEQSDQAGISRSRLVVAHADVGCVEWPGTRELAEEQARHYGLAFFAVKRRQGDLLEHIEKRGMLVNAVSPTGRRAGGYVGVLLKSILGIAYFKSFILICLRLIKMTLRDPNEQEVMRRDIFLSIFTKSSHGGISLGGFWGKTGACEFQNGRSREETYLDFTGRIIAAKLDRISTSVDMTGRPETTLLESGRRVFFFLTQSFSTANKRGQICCCIVLSSRLWFRPFRYFFCRFGGQAMCRCLAGLCAGVLLLAVCGCTVDSFLLPQSVTYGPRKVVPGTVAEVSAKLQTGLSEAGIMLATKRSGSDLRIGGVSPGHIVFCLHLREKNVNGQLQTLVRMQWDRGGDEELWQRILQILTTGNDNDRPEKGLADSQ